VLASAVLASSR